MGARRTMSSRIGSPRQNDFPRSPRRMSFSQSRYCTTYGRSRPRLARAALSCSLLRTYMPPPSPEIAASGSPGSTRMAMKMSSVTPRMVGTAISSRCARYLRTSPLSIQPERVDTTQLREAPCFAAVALDVVPPHRQVIGEPDEVEGRRLVQQHHALREELLTLGLIGLAVDLLQQLVEVRVGVARKVQRAAGLQAHLPARAGIADGRAVLRLYHHVERALLQLLDEERA